MVEVSVVIVTHNSRDDIGRCLDALARQESAPSHEVIVVDNGSSDGTRDLLRARGRRLRLVEQANLGFGAGNNAGAAQAKGRVLLFLNPDTEADPRFLAAMHAAVGPGRAATAQIVLMDDPSRINTAGHRLHFTGYGFVIGLGEPLRPAGPAVPVPGVSGGAFAILREDYGRLGGFDEDFFLYMEDTELSWRMHRAGMEVVLAPAAVVAHDYQLGFEAGKIAFLETGRLLLLRKHLPWFLWLAYAPSLLLSEVLAWARAAYMGMPGIRAKLQGYRRGSRRGIRRYRHLPRARPHAFASRAIPFRAVSRWRTVALAGGLVNLLFRLNTLLWPLRWGRPKIRRPD